MNSFASEAAAILVNVPTLERWDLFQGSAVAIACTASIDAFLFGGVSRREGERDEIGVARIECAGSRDY
jgi:hypothetical protein